MTREMLVTQIVLLAVGCAPAFDGDPFVDRRDGRRYQTVTIGNNVWLASNLAYAAPDTWCFGDDDSDCDTNGRLYQWTAALTACPTDWRLASDADWMDLELALGMSYAQASAVGPRGTTEGARLRSGGDSKFNAPISGYRRPDGTFARRHERTAFWTATEYNEQDAWHRDIRRSVGTIYRSPVTKTYALSVRCVRQATSTARQGP